MEDKSEIRRSLTWERWKSFYDLNPPRQPGRSRDESPGQAGCGMIQPDGPVAASGLTANARMLGYDTVTYPDSQFSERQPRLNLSARQLENAKAELLDQKLIKEVWLGKSLLLAPTPGLYAVMGLSSPYARNVSDVHSFLVLLAERLIQANPLVKYTRREVPLDDSNSTVDLIAYLKDGDRWAYEVIHRSITNVSATAAKLKGKGFSLIYLLATDFNLKERVWASIRNAGFDQDFLSTIRCIIFNSLFRQKKQLVLRDGS